MNFFCYAILERSLKRMKHYNCNAKCMETPSGFLICGILFKIVQISTVMNLMTVGAENAIERLSVPSNWDGWKKSSMQITTSLEWNVGASARNLRFQRNKSKYGFKTDGQSPRNILPRICIMFRNNREENNLEHHGLVKWRSFNRTMQLETFWKCFFIGKVPLTARHAWYIFTEWITSGQAIVIRLLQYQEKNSTTHCPLLSGDQKT